MTLGNQIQTRNEWHGKEGVPVKGIPLKFTIDRAEAASLYRETAAPDLLWLDKPGEPLKPLWQGIWELSRKMVGKFEDCGIKFYIGIDRALLALEPVQICDMWVEEKLGGMTQVDCRVDFHPSVDDDLRPLDHWLGRELEVEIRFGKIEELVVKDPELPLGEAKSPEAPPPKTAEEAIAADEAEQKAADDLKAREQQIATEILADREKNPPKRRRRGNGEARA